MYTTIKGIKIAGIAAAVSNKWSSLFEVSDEPEKEIQKFIKNTGVEGRYDAGEKQTTSDFCFAAAEALLKEKGISKEDIGVLIFVTQSADYGIPATACVLQYRLGLSKSCIAFDVNLGCSGFTYGITIAGSILAATNTRYALLLCGDTSAKEKDSKQKTKTTHSSTMLFGDSGTATLIEKDETAEDVVTSSNTDGAGFKAIIIPYKSWRHPDYAEGAAKGTRMDDIAVFNFASDEASAQIRDYMEQAGTTPDDYDCLVLHQANMMILKRIAKKTGFPMEKNLISIDKFANTSSSSVPITLVKVYGDSTNDHVIHALCSGFGVGLSWSTVALKINEKDILPLVHTDEYFDDGYPD